MNPNPAPNFVLMSSVRVSDFSGTLFTRTNSISATAFNTVYEDMISFLNGRSMAAGKDLPAQLLASASFGSNWHIGIDNDDLVEISSTHAFKIKFNSASTLVGNNDILGIGDSFVLYSGGATIGSPRLPYKATAPNDWQRGEIVAFSYIIEEVGSGTSSFTWNFTGGAQDLIVACRVRGNGDADDDNSNKCLEQIDIDKHSGNDIRYYLNDEGKVVTSYLVVPDITWNNSEFRNRLGFTGNETVQNINFYSVVVADNYCPGVLVPSRPYQNNYLDVINSSESRRKIGGGYVSNYVGTYLTSNLMFDLDARLDQIDLYRHFTNNFINYISSGERVNFYQVLGDSRRSSISASYTVDQPAHDLLYTSSRNGYEGRIRASMRNESFSLSYPTQLRKRVPINMRLEHLNE